MLHANLDLHKEFQETLSDFDRQRLDEDLTAFAKDIVAVQLQSALRGTNFSPPVSVGFSRTRTQPTMRAIAGIQFICLSSSSGEASQSAIKYLADFLF